MRFVKDWFCLFALTLVAGLALVGCTSQPAASSSSESDGPPTQAADGPMPEGLAKLTDAERDAALKQRVCPVSGEPLGSMGKPPKVTVNGQEVFLCCAGCEEDLRNDPEKYLAKLKSE